ncbi:MAG: pyrroline-5-carboxylate reductase [Bacilli bacterium]|nr:pyrroline-5-carboxylate reductase [Bacilli bacterium]
MKKYELGFIGLGKMGSAILSGVIKNNIYDVKDICFYDINGSASTFNIDLLEDEKSVFSASKKVILAIKPQVFDEVLEKVKGSKYDCTIISIAAGVKIEKIKAYLGDLEYIRVMPNTPFMISKGSCAMAREKSVSDKTFDEVKKIFESISYVAKVNEEDMDAVVAASGSLPAYLYLFSKVFIEEAIKKGLSEDTAKKLVTNSIIGSSYMIQESDKSIDELIKDVCSPKGTTLEGLKQLEENDFEDILRKCFKACYDRSVELGK